MPTAAEFRERLEAIRARSAALRPVGPVYPRPDVGDVILSRDRGFSASDMVSRAGQRALSGGFGLAPHGHAAICISAYEIIDATPDAGLAASPLAAWLDAIDQTNATVWRPPASVDRHALTDLIRYNYGRTYSRHFADWLPSSGDRAFFCSEYVAHVYRHFFPQHFTANRYFPKDLPQALYAAGFVESRITDLPEQVWDSTAVFLSTVTAHYHRSATVLAAGERAIEQTTHVGHVMDIAQQASAETTGDVRPQALKIARFALESGRRRTAPELPVRFEPVDDLWRVPGDATAAFRVIGRRLLDEASRHRALIQDLAAAVEQLPRDHGHGEAADYVDLLLSFLPMFRDWARFVAGLQPSAHDYADALAAEVAAINAVPADVRLDWLPPVGVLLDAIRNAILTFAPLVTSCAVVDRFMCDHPDADEQAIFDAIAAQAIALAENSAGAQFASALHAADGALARGQSMVEALCDGIGDDG